MVTPRYIIYGLVDPRTKLVRYVGLSAKGMKRPAQHWMPANRKDTYKDRWIKQLEREGLKYEIVVLQCSSRETLQTDEIWWIAFGRACGWPLTNLTDGGQGNVGYKPTAETRLKMSAARRSYKHSPETIAKAAAASAAARRSLQQKRSPEARVRMIAGRRGVVMTPEWRTNISAALRGKKRTPEQRAKMSAVQQQRAALITQCPRGHEYTVEVTAVYSGTRTCKICKNERARARKPKKGLIWDRYTAEEMSEFLKARGQKISEGRRRQSAAMTHCKHGHEFTPENTTIKKGTRECRQCISDRYYRSKNKRTEEIVSV